MKRNALKLKVKIVAKVLIHEPSQIGIYKVYIKFSCACNEYWQRFKFAASRLDEGILFTNKATYSVHGEANLLKLL